MNLKDLIAKVSGLEARATEAFKADIAQLRADVGGTIEQLKADLATATASIASLSNEKIGLEASVSELTAKLSDSNKLELDSKAAVVSHLSDLPGQDKEKLAQASLGELIAAQQSAVNSAMAASGVKVESIPAAGSTVSPVSTRSEFEKLSASAREKFFRQGGKLKE